MFFKGFWVHAHGNSDVEIMCQKIAETGAAMIWPCIEGLSNEAIARFVDAAHRNGLEFHAWMINNNARKAIREAMKDCSDWMVVSKEGKDSLTKPLWDGQTWCCPTSPAFRSYQLERIAAWIEHSEMDGLHLDYIRYPDTYRYEDGRAFERTEVPEYSFCYCDRCRALFQKEKGTDPIEIELTEGPQLNEWLTWRQAQITDEVREIRAHLPSRVALSAAVFPTPHISRTCVLQNWPDFADQLDHVCTMIYTPVQWGHPIEWVKDAAGQGLAEMKGKCTYYAGFGYPVTKLPPGELRRGMLSAKAGGADGATIFCYPGPSAEQMKEIRETNEEASA